MLSTQRSFSTSPKTLKKAAKVAKEQITGDESPTDFTELEAAIQKAHERLKEDLSKLRSGGRFNPEVVENLRVHVVKGSKETVRLSDVAQVVPRGRILNLMIGEKEHIKPISSAVQGSNLNLTPQADPQNPMQLNINLPPPTTDARQVAVQAATKAADVANNAIRNARASQQKKLKAIQLTRSARPDDIRKASTQMEKVIEKGSAEVKRIADAARKVLEST